MQVKIGDTVKIIAGKDKGKEGKIITTLKKIDKVVVEGCNIVKKHQKPSNSNENGGIFERENPIHVSNVKVIDKKDTKKKDVKEAKEVKKEPKKTAKKTKTEKGE